MSMDVVVDFRGNEVRKKQLSEVNK